MITAKRSQIYSYELIFVAVFVVILFFAVVFTHYRYTAKIDSDIMFEQMKQTLASITDVLINSRGYPYNWETLAIQDVETFGLMNKTTVLDEKKLEKFFVYLGNSGDRERLKNSLGISAYQFKVNMSLSDNSYSIERGDTITAKNVYVLSRNIIYKGKEGVISFVAGK